MRLAAGIAPLATIWSLLQDARPELGVPPAYGTTGLLRADGTAKPAKATWERSHLPAPVAPKQLARAASERTASSRRTLRELGKANRGTQRARR